jgi:hypothetical protein
MAQNEWKQKTIAQAIADKEGIVTLHFGKQKFFEIDGEADKTDKYGDYEFDLESFFVEERLGFLGLEGTVKQVIEKATEYLLAHETKEDIAWRAGWQDDSDEAETMREA